MTKRPLELSNRARAILLTLTSISAVMILITGFILFQPGSTTSVIAEDPKPPVASTPSPVDGKTEVAPPVPVQSSQQELAAVPLAFYDAVIPAVLTQSEVKPVETWLAARPTTPLTALYGSIDSSSTPIAAIALTTVEDVTKLAVFGVYGSENSDGGWLLVGTPSRKVLPSKAGGTAPGVTFAYARAVDFEVEEIDRKLVVDTTTGAVSLAGKDGTILHSETGTLGSAADPTPRGWGYITATYKDAKGNRSSGGYSIALTSAHSEKLDTYYGSNALTGVHYSTSNRATSFGCVRISKAFAKILEGSTGIPIFFK